MFKTFILFAFGMVMALIPIGIIEAIKYFGGKAYEYQRDHPRMRKTKN